MTANEPDLPPLPPKWSDSGYLAREAERRRTAVPPEALSAALAAWDARITGPIVSDTEGTEDALQEVVEAAFRAAPRRAPEPPVALRDVGRARRALRAFRDHLGEDPGPAVVDALNSALLAYDPPPAEPHAAGRAEQLVAEGRRRRLEAERVLHRGVDGLSVDSIRAVVVALDNAGMLDRVLPAEPPADLREAIARALWARSDLDREENPDQFDTDPDRGFWHRQADAVLPIVQAHVAAVRQQAWTEGGRAGAVEASRAAALDAEATWQRFVRQLRSRADQIAAGGEQRG